MPRLMMDGLKAHCCNVLVRGLTVANFALRLQISDFLDDDRLYRRLVTFLASNRKDILTHPRPVVTMSSVENYGIEAEGKHMHKAEEMRVRAAQEASSRIEAELEQMHRKYAEQQRELERLRKQRESAESSAGEVKKVPEWARATARATDMDLAAEDTYFYYTRPLPSKKQGQLRSIPSESDSELGSVRSYGLGDVGSDNK
ncbi:hypothetical protein Aduo_008077 [Ancylostoma duodenale]